MCLEIKFFNVDLGNCTYIKTPYGQNIIFDLGSNEYFSIIECLKNRDEELHYLIISHPHEDHISDLINIDGLLPIVLSRNKNVPESLIKNSIDNATYEKDKEVFKKYLKLNQLYTSSVPDSLNPAIPSNNGGIQFELFVPSTEESDNLNDYSLAMFLYYKSYTILLMGDNTPNNISELMEDENFLNKIKDVDILLAPHHGRNSSYDIDFVNHVNPRLTIISDKSGTDDVSAVDKYSKKSRGLIVFNGPFREERKCLTTRNDGEITVVVDDELKIFINN